jgi:hypothetical protein
MRIFFWLCNVNHDLWARTPLALMIANAILVDLEASKWNYVSDDITGYPVRLYVDLDVICGRRQISRIILAGDVRQARSLTA